MTITTIKFENKLKNLIHLRDLLNKVASSAHKVPKNLLFLCLQSFESQIALRFSIDLIRFSSFGSIVLDDCVKTKETVYITNHKKKDKLRCNKQ